VQIMLSEPNGSARPAEEASVSVAAQRTFSDMVEFSRRSMQLLQTATRLGGWFTPWWMRPSADDVSFKGVGDYRLAHLKVPPEISSTEGIRKEAINQIEAYQNIREFALGLFKIDTLIYSSLSTYFLPTIYALLGAYLYGFRIYTRLIQRMEYTPSAAYSARYFIAAIAGLVVGLFGSLLPKDLQMPPLVVAFLVGYAVEAFFSRLDDVITQLKKEPDAPAARKEPETAMTPEVVPAGD
jgi:hypothetical protein